jgi:hypothetical protein
MRTDGGNRPYEIIAPFAHEMYFVRCSLFFHRLFFRHHARNFHIGSRLKHDAKFEYREQQIENVLPAYGMRLLKQSRRLRSGERARPLAIISEKIIRVTDVRLVACRWSVDNLRKPFSLYSSRESAPCLSAVGCGGCMPVFFVLRKICTRFYPIALAPACATSSSSWDCTPDTPIAPTHSF